MKHNPIICAIDTPTIEGAKRMISKVAPHVGAIKLGLEFFVANGIEGVKRVMDGVDAPLFLDLKFHDIPNTVAKAIASTSSINCFLLTIHTSGGKDMMRHAAEAAASLPNNPTVIGVTVLTSMDEDDLSDIGCTRSAKDQVVNLARLAKDSGLGGVVCSPLEVSFIRHACGSDFTLVVPGIRPAGSNSNDQKRTMTPRDAVELGADYLVIGRPITGADYPDLAAAKILESL
jgi:orotidine-5'-phosphate decarboxylase